MCAAGDQIVSNEFVCWEGWIEGESSCVCIVCMVVLCSVCVIGVVSLCFWYVVDSLCGLDVVWV